MARRSEAANPQFTKLMSELVSCRGADIRLKRGVGTLKGWTAPGVERLSRRFLVKPEPRIHATMAQHCTGC